MLLSSARRYLLPAAAVLALLWGCSGIKISHTPNRPDADGRAAVAGLAQDYAAQHAEPFFQRVDQARFPSYEIFRDNVRQFLLRVHQISLDIVVDRALAAGSGVAVDAHWNRSFVDKSGNRKIQAGTCSFVFTRDPSGALLLSAIQGKSPF